MEMLLYSVVHWPFWINYTYVLKMDGLPPYRGRPSKLGYEIADIKRKLLQK
jgi:hypothetical protein